MFACVKEDISYINWWVCWGLGGGTLASGVNCVGVIFLVKTDVSGVWLTVIV